MRYLFHDTELIVGGSLEETLKWTAQTIYTYAEEVIQKKGVCKVALSGGKTPLDLFKIFSQEPNREIWKSIELFWNDERYVPIDHQESNFGNAFKILKKLIGPTFFPMIQNELLSLQELAVAYSKVIQPKLPFDLSILGIGEDGHIASLFPCHPGFLEEKKIWDKGEKNHFQLVGAFHIPEKGWRLSLSLHSILTASFILVLVTGESKRLIVERILNRKDPSLPAHLLVGRKNVLFILDQASSFLMDL